MLGLAAVLEAISRALADAIDGVVDSVQVARLHGGACQDLFKVEARIDGEPRRFVLRSDANSSLPSSLGRSAEYAVIVNARCGGVRTPRVFGLTKGLVREGADAYFMDWADGETIGAKVLRDPALAKARSALPAALARELSAIHSVEPTFAISAWDSADRSDPAASAIARQRAALDQIAEPRPVLELVLSWLDAHRPPPDHIGLVHGDFRTGNFAVGPDGLTAIFDWEFAHWGDPLEDVAWLCMRDWRFGQVKLAAGGLCERKEFYRLYAEASGRAVDPARVRFWEIMGNVRWGLGAFIQGQRYLEGKETDLELIAIGRRTQEMELEALRLIEES